MCIRDSITGVNAELIAKAARMYATEGSACIPWTPITDQQVSSTSAIRLQCMLRALSGNLDIKGGDQFVGFSPTVRSDSEIECHEVLPEAQKMKQLGIDQFPVYTYKGMRPMEDATEKVWGTRYANLVNGCDRLQRIIADHHTNKVYRLRILGEGTDYHWLYQLLG